MRDILKNKFENKYLGRVIAVLEKNKNWKPEKSIAEKVPRQTDEKIHDMLNTLPLESKEEVRHGTKLKALTPNKRLTRLLILFAK